MLGFPVQVSFLRRREVGKTSLLVRLSGGGFEEPYKPLEQNIIFSFAANDQVFRDYDIIYSGGFDFPEWNERLRTHTHQALQMITDRSKLLGLAVLGNKVDLIDKEAIENERSINRGEATNEGTGRETSQKLAKEGMVPTFFIETSAKTGQNISQFHIEISKLI